MNRQDRGEIIIYQSPGEKTALEVKLVEDSVWLNLGELALLFERDKSVISRHINTICKTGELDRDSTVAKFATVQKEGQRSVKRRIEYYNLDMIISVGYRVNSKIGTQFRIWATNVLREYTVKGYALNEKRLKEGQRRKLQELERTVALINQVIESRQLTEGETTGLLGVITNFTHTWSILRQYDEKTLSTKGVVSEISYTLNYQDTLRDVATFKQELIQRNEASEIFGLDKSDQLKGILGTIDQTFDGKDLYPTIEDKAAHLLYFIIKDHPFVDGNKRIASLLFILYLKRNEYDKNIDGKDKFNDSSLIALSLLIAESNPKQKEILIRLIMNLVKNKQ